MHCSPMVTLSRFRAPRPVASRTMYPVLFPVHSFRISHLAFAVRGAYQLVYHVTPGPLLP